MTFGDVIRVASSAGLNTTGMGGDLNTIWNCDVQSPKSVYEISVSDLSTVRRANSPGSWPSGIGGNNNTIWHCDDNDIVYELSVVDLSVIRSAGAPSTITAGIGGDSDTIWECDYGTDKVYELSTVDFSIVRNSNSPSAEPRGIGGDAHRIWHCDNAANRNYELSVTDFSVLLSASSPKGLPFGIGGDLNTIWHCDNLSWFYELDTGDITISGNVKDNKGYNLPDVSIELIDTIEYSTTTDASGNYSQVVDPDIYAVTASVTGNGLVPETASVDASSSDQTQDFILDRTTAPHDKGIKLLERHLIE